MLSVCLKCWCNIEEYYKQHCLPNFHCGDYSTCDSIGKLHNNCIQSGIDGIVDKSLVYMNSNKDKIFTNENGFVAVKRSKNNYGCPDLIGDGKDFHNIPNRKFWHSNNNPSKLPCTILHKMVIDSYKTRPQL